MSNLLNNPKKNNLLNRGPRIVPEQSFSDSQKIAEKDKKITSVRVSKSTQKQLNALVGIGKATNVDELIEIMLNEYKSTHLIEEEQKQYDMLMQILDLKK